MSRVHAAGLLIAAPSAAGHFANEILKHREQSAPQRRDIGGPVTPGAMMPMMAGNPNARNQVGWFLNKRRTMPNVGGAQEPAQAPTEAAPLPAQGFGASPMAPAPSPPPA